MDKEQLIDLLNILQFNKKEYCILAGSSLVFHNIKDKTGDLDLYVSQSLFGEIQDKYDLINKDPERTIYKYPLFNITKYDVDIYLMDEKCLKIDYIDDYPTEDLEEILKYKLARNLEKDQIDIKNIKAYLNSKILLGDYHMDCIFCKIANGDIPSYTIYEDDIVKVFLDIHPNINGHMLVIPKKHYLDINDIDDDILKYIYKEIAPKMYKILKAKLSADGFNISQNNGSAQDVKHYHVHITPRFKHNTKIDDVKNIFEKLK